MGNSQSAMNEFEIFSFSVSRESQYTHIPPKSDREASPSEFGCDGIRTLHTRHCGSMTEVGLGQRNTGDMEIHEYGGRDCAER